MILTENMRLHYLLFGVVALCVVGNFSIMGCLELLYYGLFGVVALCVVGSCMAMGSLELCYVSVNVLAQLPV